MKFRCSGCGECCKHINVAVENTKHLKELEFPYKWDESGRCDKLGEDNRCTVYNNRPLLCNIDKFIKVFKIDKDKFYDMNIKACNDLMDDNNVDLSFRI